MAGSAKAMGVAAVEYKPVGRRVTPSAKHPSVAWGEEEGAEVATPVRFSSLFRSA